MHLGKLVMPLLMFQAAHSGLAKLLLAMSVARMKTSSRSRHS